MNESMILTDNPVAAVAVTRIKGGYTVIALNAVTRDEVVVKFPKREQAKAWATARHWAAVSEARALADAALATEQDEPAGGWACGRCGDAGMGSSFPHINDGRCFECGLASPREAGIRARQTTGTAVVAETLYVDADPSRTCGYWVGAEYMVEENHTEPIECGDPATIATPDGDRMCAVHYETWRTTGQYAD